MTLNTTTLSTPEMDRDVLVTSRCATHNISASSHSQAARTDVIVEAHSTPDAVAVRSPEAWPQILGTLGKYSFASMDLTKTPDIPVGARTLHSPRTAARPDWAPNSTITLIEKLPDTLVSKIAQPCLKGTLNGELHRYAARPGRGSWAPGRPRFRTIPPQ